MEMYDYNQTCSIALAEQITTIDKRYVGNKIGFIKEDSEVFTQIMDAVKVQMGYSLLLVETNESEFRDMNKKNECNIILFNLRL